jgi:hypothetical protein
MENIQPEENKEYICKGHWRADGHLNDKDKMGWARCLYKNGGFTTIEDYASQYLGFHVDTYFPLSNLDNLMTNVP